MAITVVDKDNDCILITEDGKTRAQSIRAEDTVVSVPVEGFKKVHNIYVHPDTGKLVVIHEA